MNKHLPVTLKLFNRDLINQVQSIKHSDDTTPPSKWQTYVLQDLVKADNGSQAEKFKSWNLKTKRYRSDALEIRVFTVRLFGAIP